MRSLGIGIEQSSKSTFDHVTPSSVSSRLICIHSISSPWQPSASSHAPQSLRPNFRRHADRPRYVGRRHKRAPLRKSRRSTSHTTSCKSAPCLLGRTFTVNRLSQVSFLYVLLFSFRYFPFYLSPFSSPSLHLFHVFTLVDDAPVVVHVKANSVKFTPFRTPLFSLLSPAGPQWPSPFVLPLLPLLILPVERRALVPHHLGLAYKTPRAWPRQRKASAGPLLLSIFLACDHACPTVRNQAAAPSIVSPVSRTYVFLYFRRSTVLQNDRRSTAASSLFAIATRSLRHQLSFIPAQVFPARSLSLGIVALLLFFPSFRTHTRGLITYAHHP